MRIHPTTREEWRDWLERNHEHENVVWLMLHKKHTGKPTIAYQDALDEAICFGWIDTTVKRIDDDRYARCFRKRKNGGRWSENTLSYARRLIGEGRMTPAGLRAYELGRKKPTHDHGIPKDPGVPDDLKRALAGSAKRAFEALAPSYRKAYLRWLARAKRNETRQKRIREIIRGVKDGKRLGEK